MSHPDDFISINLHLTEICNMKCEACFAKYPEGHRLRKDGWLDCLHAIDRDTRSIGSRKINFAGGEPTLLPYLGTLIIEAKRLGFTTGIVTNGRTIDEAFLGRCAGSLDTIGISVDSVHPETNLSLGRYVEGAAWGIDEYLGVIKKVRAWGYKLKINTVVSALNCNEDFSDFIAAATPERWKVMQCLIVKGQNDRVARLAVKYHEFREFLSRHRAAQNLVIEDSESMRGSYVMVDPRGLPYGNANGIAVFGKRIQSAGLLAQLNRLGYSVEKARERGADFFQGEEPNLVLPERN
jgi:radical S-adenosyl methionine domain-containing protein 2